MTTCAPSVALIFVYGISGTNAQFLLSLHKCIKVLLVQVVLKNVDWCRKVRFREENIRFALY